MNIDKAEQIQADIDIKEEPLFTQKEWLLQKIAWLSLFVIIGLVITGLFGDGHLSFVSMNKKGFNLQYDQYFRYQAEKTIRISSKSQTVKTVAIAQSLVNNFQVTQIIPQPTRSYIENDSRVYEFYGDRNFIVIFYLTPMELGKTEGTVKVNQVDFNLKHFIYP